MAPRLDVRALVERYELFARRGLGQNFLTDPNVIDRIAEEALRGDEPTIVEVGPGLGSLTLALLTRGRRVVAIEKDRQLAEVLRRELAAFDTLELLEGDALESDLAAVAGGRPAVAGNLPYNITSPLLLHILAQRAAIGATTVMVQREVAARLVAEPGTKAYGSLSVLFQLLADLDRAIEVGPRAFWPAPKVSSTVLAIDWLPAPRVPVPDLAHFERVTRAAFAQRRKTLRNTLSARFGREPALEAGAQTGIDLGRRAETLELAELAALAAALPG